MLVKVSQSSFGSFTAIPVSKVWRARFGDYMLQWFTNLLPSQLAEAYFQGYYELPEEISQNWQFPELDRGWDITIRVGPWVFGHWLGWDAHTVAEGIA